MIKRVALVGWVSILAAPGVYAAPTPETTKIVGRVRVTEIRDTQADTAKAALDARYAAAASGKRFADRRVLSIRPRLDGSARVDATIYDYTVERAFELVLDAKGTELSRVRMPMREQPGRAPDEFADAVTIVRE